MPTASSSPDRAPRRGSTRVHAGYELAPGEAILWQGQPSWLGVARHFLCGDLVLAYFVLLLIIGCVRAALGLTSVAALVGVLPPAFLVGSIIAVLARAITRSTYYIVTPRRIVIRYGVALPRSLSLPFSQIASLSVAARADGRGDIAFRMRGGAGLRYLKLWPHARPWRFASPEPAFRDIADAGLVATRLTRILVEAEEARGNVASPRTLAAG